MTRRFRRGVFYRRSLEPEDAKRAIDLSDAVSLLMNGFEDGQVTTIALRRGSIIMSQSARAG